MDLPYIIHICSGFANNANFLKDLNFYGDFLSRKNCLAHKKANLLRIYSTTNLLQINRDFLARLKEIKLIEIMVVG